MTRVLSVAAVALLVALPAPAPAQEKLPDGTKVVRLDARPASVKLAGPFAYSQLLVTAKLDSGEAVDVTRIAKLDLPAKLVTASGNGLVRPAADGSGDITVSLAGQTVRVPVTVTGTTGAGRAVAEAAAELNRGAQPMGSVGLVVGATVGDAAAELGIDLAAVNGPLLAPGVGAQGATPADVAKVFGSATSRVLVSQSRGVLQAGPFVEKLRGAIQAAAGAAAYILAPADEE